MGEESAVDCGALALCILSVVLDCWFGSLGVVVFGILVSGGETNAVG